MHSKTDSLTSKSEAGGLTWAQTERALGICVGTFGLFLTLLSILTHWQSFVQTPLSLRTLTVILLFGSLLGTIFASRRRYWFARTGALSFLVILVLWQLGFIGNILPPDSAHWPMGIAGSATGLAAIAWRWRAALLYASLVFLLPILEVIPFQQSTRTLRDSSQESLLGLGLVIAIIAPLEVLRRAATATDCAAAASMAAFTELTRAVELQTERTRLDTLTHDTILSTLTVAAQATDLHVAAAAAAAARQALIELDDYTRPCAVRLPLPLEDFLQRLHAANNDGPAVIHAEDLGADQTMTLPAHVADALLQATHEAVRNAVRHTDQTTPTVSVSVAKVASGAAVKLDAKKILTLEIFDDGPGFDLTLIPPERMGISHSLVARMRAAGGNARVETAPGQGTRILLSWPDLELAAASG